MATPDALEPGSDRVGTPQMNKKELMELVRAQAAQIRLLEARIRRIKAGME